MTSLPVAQFPALSVTHCFSAALYLELWNAAFEDLKASRKVRQLASPLTSKSTSPKQAVMSEALEKLRQQCRERGANGIIGLSRAFRLMDDNRDKKLDLEEMKYGLQEYGADMSASEVSALFKELDKDGSGTVSFDEFLRAVRPPLSQDRLDMIEKAFAIMDKSGDGIINLQDLKGVYNAKEHPDVIAQKKTEDQVLVEFLENFETPNNPDGKVTKQEFIDYYTGVSSSIDLDEYFVTMMQKAWKM